MKKAGLLTHQRYASCSNVIPERITLDALRTTLEVVIHRIADLKVVNSPFIRKEVSGQPLVASSQLPIMGTNRFRRGI